jgi:hypothetical protein
MKITLELDVSPVAGGPISSFERIVRWEVVPRIDDYVELLRGSDVASPVESVVFHANGSLRVILVTYEEDDADRVISQLRGESSRWIEHKDDPPRLY